jgi:hypothetical protein
VIFILNPKSQIMRQLQRKTSKHFAFLRAKISETFVKKWPLTFIQFMSASPPLTHAWRDRRGSDLMVDGFTIIYAISTYHHIAAGIDMGVSGWHQCQYGKSHVWYGKFHVIIYLLHIFHWLFSKHCILYCRKDLWTDKLRKKILKRVAFVRVWFQKDIKQCRSVQWR